MTFESLVNELLRWEEQPSLTPEELCREYSGKAAQRQKRPPLNTRASGRLIRDE
jgi:hypothetical protein